MRDPIIITTICLVYIVFIFGRFIIYSLLTPGDLIIKKDEKPSHINSIGILKSFVEKFFFSTFMILYFISALYSLYNAIGIKVQNFAPFEQGIKISQHLLNRFHITSVYSGYSKIEGRKGRNELEISVYDPVLQWQTVDFRYKVASDVSQVLKKTYTHFPRIDWLMNRAANSENINSEGWLIILLGKLLEKNPVILDLLGYYVNQKEFFYTSKQNYLFLIIASIFEKFIQIFIGVDSPKNFIANPEKVKVAIWNYTFTTIYDYDKKKSYWNKAFLKNFIGDINQDSLKSIYSKYILPEINPKREIHINPLQNIPIIDIVIIFIFIRLFWK